MRGKPAEDKQPWEYVIVFLGVIITLAQATNLFSPAGSFFANSFTTTFFVIILLVAISGVSLVLILRKDTKKSKRAKSLISLRRRFATIALGISALGIVVTSILGFVYRPCLLMPTIKKEGEFLLLIADFTEGVNRIPSIRGEALTEDLLFFVEGEIYYRKLPIDLGTAKVCAIRNESEAIRAGKSANASLVIWGNLSEYQDDTFRPFFTILPPLSWLPRSEIIESIAPIYEGKLNYEETGFLSSRAASLAVFVAGSMLLDTASKESDYWLAIEEFSSAIELTENELEQYPREVGKEPIKRSLAIYYAYRGRAYNALGQSERALEDFNEAIKIDPKYPLAYLLIGNHYYSMRDFNLAEVNYRIALSLELKESAASHYNLANALYYLGRYDESISHYLEAIELIDADGFDSTNVRIILGIAYMTYGEYDHAIEQFNLVIQSNKATYQQTEYVKEQIEKINRRETISLVPFGILTPPILPSHTSFPMEETLTPYPTDTLFPTASSSPYPTETPFPTMAITPSNTKIYITRTSSKSPTP